MDITIPSIICHLQESHSEMLGKSQGSRSRDQSLSPHTARVPNAAGSCLRRSPPPASLQSLLQALRQVLSVPPRRTLQTRPALFSCPRGSRCPGSSWAPGPRMGCCLQSQRPQVSSQKAREAAPSLLRRASGRAPRPKRGAAGRGGRGSGGWGTRRGRSRSARPPRYLSPNNVATRGEH